ncbi:MAG: hypothetical protein EWM47_05775 [Anaerolineaceae bacterium]|nr:MAG: hypothetical protein EWM47_05775 [Anaerolineaceae bacterium]
MKKIIAIICICMGLLLHSTTAYADSPITSTPFYKEYLDFDIVQASEQGTINEEIAEYLADESNPIDIKAAVINALSWDFYGKDNAEIYSQLIYGKPINELDFISLPGDQQFCIGYLMAMDDYFDVEQALEYLKIAEENSGNSFTVSIIRALVEAMDMGDNIWYQYIEPVLNDSSLNKDLSEDALQIIVDYMITYSVEPWITPKTGVTSMEFFYGIGTVLCATGVIFGKKLSKKAK